jgi:hypothetical protein
MATAELSKQRRPGGHRTSNTGLASADEPCPPGGAHFDLFIARFGLQVDHPWVCARERWALDWVAFAHRQAMGGATEC